MGRSKKKLKLVHDPTKILQKTFHYNESEIITIFASCPSHKDEDRYAILEQKELNEHGKIRGFWAIYDGHGGHRASDYLSNYLHKHLLKYLKEQDPENYVDAILAGFEKAQEEFLKLAAHGKWREGSTALVLMLLDKELYVVNLGDSRSVLETSKGPLRVTRDHSCEDPSERRLIKKMGGKVRLSTGHIYRVRDSTGTHGLAPSRSFGDINWKEPTELMSSTPEVRTIELNKEDLFLVAASDGLWGVMSDQEVTDYLLDYFNSGKEIKGASNALIKQAQKKGSVDDITVIILIFQPFQESLNAP